MVSFPFTTFINNIFPLELISLVKKIALKEPLLEIKKNGFMSGLILMMLLKLEAQLEEEEVRRMLVLSMMGIDRMRSAMRLFLRKKLTLKCKLVNEVEGKRKKLIWSRREAKAREDGQKWRERVERKMEKPKVKEAVQKKVMRKVGRWVRNLEKEEKKKE